MLRVRIVKSDNCWQCANYIPRLKKLNYEFELFDGDAPENQALLDAWHIEEFPVVQIMDGDKIVHQFPPGTYSMRAIEYQKKQLEAKEKRHDH